MNGRSSIGAALGLIAATAFLALVPSLSGDYATGVALQLLMWIALTESWIVLSGLTGYISLGHAVFFGAGAYVMVLVWGEVPIWGALLLSGAAAVGLALAVGYPCLRVRGPYFVILTFGLAELVKWIVVNVEAGLGRFSRILFGAPSIETLYYVMLGLAVAGVALAYLVRRSRFGAGLRALRENEEAAETIGVNVGLWKLAAFALSAAIPGMVGATMALRTTYFEPLQVFNPLVSFTIVTVAVIGGSDDAPGPIYGAVFLVLLSELLWANAPQLYMILVGVLLVGFTLWAPEGMHGRLSALARRKWR